MFFAEPLLIDSRTAPAPQPVRALARLLRNAAAKTVRGLCESERLLAWHRCQRPAAAGPRAWRRQSALLCLRSGLDREALR
jgi:hypothetical protein